MLPDAWYRLVCRAAVALHYRRVLLLGGEHLPAGDAGGGPHARRRPVLYVGLHRNGAVDGMVYKTLFPRATFLVAARLLRSAFSRLFFTGIPVARAKDGLAGRDDRADRESRTASDAALAACAAHLRAGGELFVFPEGTSDLGPRHLPFKRGAARVAAAVLDDEPSLTILPVGIFYRAADQFRSDVVVVVGPALATSDVAALPSTERADALHDRITTALEAIGVNTADAATLARVERLAAVAADGDLARYYVALKTLEARCGGGAAATLPAHYSADWARIEADVAHRRLATEFGAPVFSRRGPLWSAAWLLVQLPVVAAAALANALPIAAAALAAHFLADARNTVALWRLLVGLPALALWTLAVAGAALTLGQPWWLAGYVAVTVAGLALYHELLARLARLRNALGAPRLAGPLRRVQRWLAHEVSYGAR